MMATITAMAVKDAAELWKRTLASRPGAWTVHDQEHYNKGVFYSSKEPTTRTLTLKLDVSDLFNKAWDAQKEAFSGRVDLATFRLNYMRALTTQFLFHANAGAKYAIMVTSQRDGKDDAVAVCIEYKYTLTA